MSLGNTLRPPLAREVFAVNGPGHVLRSPKRAGYSISGRPSSHAPGSPRLVPNSPVVAGTKGRRGTAWVRLSQWDGGERSSGRCVLVLFSVAGLTFGLRNRRSQVRILSGALTGGGGFRFALRNRSVRPRLVAVAPNLHLRSQAEWDYRSNEPACLRRPGGGSWCRRKQGSSKYVAGRPLLRLPLTSWHER